MAGLGGCSHAGSALGSYNLYKKHIYLLYFALCTGLVYINYDMMHTMLALTLVNIKNLGTKRITEEIEYRNVIHVKTVHLSIEYYYINH
jgi:hypothetical protein